jgi:hypothetical protein
MTTHYFYLTGLIYRIPPESLLHTLQAISGSTQLKDSFQGYEILFKMGHSTFHFNSMQGNHTAWSMNGNFKGNKEAFTTLVAALERVLIEANAVYSMGYQEEDAEGNELGEEVQVDHPDFGEAHLEWGNE